MSENKLSDVNQILFNQLNKLSKYELGLLTNETKLKQLVDQSKSMTKVTVEIVKIHKLELDAAVLLRRNAIAKKPRGFQEE